MSGRGSDQGRRPALGRVQDHPRVLDVDAGLDAVQQCEGLIVGEGQVLRLEPRRPGQQREAMR